MASSTPTPRRKIEPNTSPAVIEAGAVYTAEEMCRRLRWARHSFRQARRLGLRLVKFGGRLYASGDDILQFFDRLAAEQNNEEGGTHD